VDTSLNLSQQCALAEKKGKDRLGCIRRSAASKLRGATLPLYSVNTWAPQYKRDMDILERAQQTATKMTEELEHFTYEERLRECGLFSLEKRRLGGTL